MYSAVASLPMLAILERMVSPDNSIVLPIAESVFSIFCPFGIYKYRVIKNVITQNKIRINALSKKVLIFSYVCPHNKNSISIQL